MPADFDSLFDRPVIILAAPRSGSTLLFETLSESPDVWTVGGESHQFIEGIRKLTPMLGEVDSNRLDASHASAWVIALLRQRFAHFLRDRDGHEFIQQKDVHSLRFLEKTPKNAVRQPFLDKVFPGALYIYLFRDPRPNISSMMEAWKSPHWVTYPRLRGWRGPPWSLLLPPGWQALSGRPLAEVCAFQWAASNRIILDDLNALPKERWIACDYSDLKDRSNQTIERICRFAGLQVDQRLQQRINGPLPLSRYTQTPPEPEKWRRNEEQILPVLDSVKEIWKRCERLLEQCA